MGYKLNSAVRVEELCAVLGGVYKGENVYVSSVAPFSEHGKGDLTFSLSKGEVVAGAVLIANQSDCLFDGTTSIMSTNPRLDFVKALTFLTENVGFSDFAFESVISETAVLGENVVIESGCIIDDGVTIEHNCIIHSGTRIGKNSRIRSGCCIGGDGFGFERLPDGSPIRFPHLGGVLIGENVEIGAMNSIAKGTLSDTRIEDFVKTDNLVHIAHNCHIKKGAFITACAELSGGVTVGENAWIGPNVSIIQKRNVGSDALVGIGAVVTKDVDTGCVYAGNPAKKLRKI